METKNICLKLLINKKKAVKRRFFGPPFYPLLSTFQPKKYQFNSLHKVFVIIVHKQWLIHLPTLLKNKHCYIITSTAIFVTDTATSVTGTATYYYYYYYYYYYCYYYYW